MRSKISLHIFAVGLICAIAVLTISILITGSFLQRSEEQNVLCATKAVEQYYEEQGTVDLNLPSISCDSQMITLFTPEGDVIYDSGDPVLYSYECEDAKQGGYVFASRHLNESTQERMYCAVQLSDGNILRVSSPYMTAINIMGENAGAFSLLFVAVFVFLVAVSVVLAKRAVKPIIEVTTSNKMHIYPEIDPLLQTIYATRCELSATEDQLFLERARLESLARHTIEGFLLVDSRCNVVIANKVATGIFGELQGHHYEQGIRDGRIRSAIMSALSGQGRVDSTTFEDSEIKIITNPIHIDSRPQGALCIVYEVGDNAKVRTMKQELTANVSHELKTPLTSISGYAELIATGIAKQEDIPGFAMRIHKEAKRLLVLISEIIKLSKLDAADSPEMAQNINLYSMGEECIDLLSEAASRHNVTLKIAGGGGNVVGNEIMVNELMYILLDNAIGYNKPGGSVTLRIAEKSLTVQDEGIGISEENQSQIFERFFRVDKSRSKETGGTGLGLAIVKHIAELHGAAIQIQSELDKGTAITVIFKK